MSNKITCKNCGAENVPDWDGKGHCITCARDAVLGPLSKEELRENIKTLLTSDTTYLIPPGVDETKWYLDNIISLKLSTDIFLSLIAQHTDAILDRVDGAVPEKRIDKNVEWDCACGQHHSYTENSAHHWNQAIDQTRTAIAKLREDLK